jgi:predicted dehydrogenase
MKVLIAGLGSIGRRHLQNLRSLVPLEAVAYRVRGHELPSDLRGNWLVECDDLEKALSLRPEAALICSPPSAQMSIALAAAHAGCHLFIEKPISSSLEGMDDLISLARTRKLVTLIGYNLRFHPGLKLVKSLLDESRIGKVVSIRAEVGQYLPDWHPKEDYRRGYSARRNFGGGVLVDLIHELDYVRWLIGEIDQLKCFAGHLSGLEIETEDIAEILLQFETGTIGSIHLDYVQRSPTRTCIIWDYFENEVRLYEVNRPQWQVFHQTEFERNDMYMREMEHFLDCIRGYETPVVDLEDGARTLQLALTARGLASPERMRHQQTLSYTKIAG